MKEHKIDLEFITQTLTASPYKLSNGDRTLTLTFSPEVSLEGVDHHHITINKEGLETLQNIINGLLDED